MKGNNMICQPLPRELTVKEHKMFDAIKKDYETSGKCGHLLVKLFGENSGPFHGCIICGKPMQ